MSKQADRAQAAQWARDLLAGEFVILDAETTHLDTHIAEMVQVAVINREGDALFDSLVKPLHPQVMYRRGKSGKCAFDIHRIGQEMLVDAPEFGDIYPDLQRILSDQHLIIYNADYDWAILNRLCHVHGVSPIKIAKLDCAMKQYARWFGEWNPRYRSYKYQPLVGGDHTALGDCRATLALIRKMANQKDK